MFFPHYRLSALNSSSVKKTIWYDLTGSGSMSSGLQSLDLEIGQGRSLENVGCDCSES